MIGHPCQDGIDAGGLGGWDWPGGQVVVMFDQRGDRADAVDHLRIK